MQGVRLAILRALSQYLWRYGPGLWGCCGGFDAE
jgi:hypothetical protein